MVTFRRGMSVFILIAFICAGCSKSTESLIKDLESGSSITRAQAATRLMKRRYEPETVKKVIDLLDNDNELTILIATQILGAYPDTTVIEPLGRMIDHPNPFIRERAVQSLGTVGNESGIPYIEIALSDSVSGVRHAAITSLGNMQYSPATKFIFNMFRDEADSVRAAAVQALYRYRMVEGANVMASDFAVPLTDNSDLVRYVTVQALGWELPGGYPDSTVAGEMLIEALKDVNKHVRLEAIFSLDKIVYEDAVPYLKSMYDLATLDEEYAISEAIKNITGEDFPPLEE